MEYKHTPVLLEEVIRYLDPKPGAWFFDGTLGGGAYTRKITKLVGEKGQVLATDLDWMAIEHTKKWLKLNKKINIKIINDNFRNLHKIIRSQWPEKDISFDGMVLDLGLSSAQLADPDRGFSFKLDAPLSMGFAHQSRNVERGTRNVSKRTAKEVINKYDYKKLLKIFKEYGEERYAKSIARAIVEYRKDKKIERTGELVNIIESAVPANYKRGKIHFATKTFQAIRMEVNQELESLKDFLPQAFDFLKVGGRLAIVSFHSLEDRIVKNFFRTEAKDCICPPEQPLCSCGHIASLKIITKKPIKASKNEIADNPRSRSALLRVAEKI